MIFAGYTLRLGFLGAGADRKKVEGKDSLEHSPNNE